MLKINTSIFVGILLTTTFSVPLMADSAVFDPYAIPHDKSILEHCRQAALAERPGQVNTFQIHNTPAGFHYQFEIEAQDKSHWTVVCEGTNRKIISNHKKE